MDSTLTRKDPRGLVRRDLEELMKMFPRKPYSNKMTHAEIMRIEGQQDVINYINQIVNRGLNHERG